MNYKNIKIISEFAHNALIRSGISAKDYLNVLANAGFKAYKIIEEKDETTLRLINYSQFNEFVRQVGGITNIIYKENKNVT